MLGLPYCRMIENLSTAFARTIWDATLNGQPAYLDGRVDEHARRPNMIEVVRERLFATKKHGPRQQYIELGRKALDAFVPARFCIINEIANAQMYTLRRNSTIEGDVAAYSAFQRSQRRCSVAQNRCEPRFLDPSLLEMHCDRKTS